MAETNQNSYDRIVVGVTGIVRQSLNELEQIHDEVIVHLQQILGAQVFNSGHLVHQLQQKPV